MSGGHFDYKQFDIDHVADELERYISKCENNGFDGWNPDYSPDTIAKFKECLRYLKIGGKMLHRIDWLASGDDGEETFHKRLAEDLAGL